MYEHIVQAVQALPWAILPEKLAVIREILILRANGQRVTPEEIKAELEAARNGERQMVSGGSMVAVIPIVGTLIPRGNMMMEMSGAVSVQQTQARFRAALSDPEVGSILLDIDSPGGQVGGIEELAEEIYQARGQKPITAVANTLAASAAYWLASAAGELVVTPSGEVGSIGVFAMHEDISAALDKLGVAVNLIAAGKYKTEGNPFEPLGQEAREAIQGRVNEYYDMFTRAVARGRGVSQADVIGGFGEGRVVGAEQAVRLGMADRAATIDEVIGGLMADAQRRKPIRADDADFRQRRLRAYSRLRPEAQPEG
jgi:signal peptide peptidase SppA